MGYLIVLFKDVVYISAVESLLGKGSVQVGEFDVTSSVPSKLHGEHACTAVLMPCC